MNENDYIVHFSHNQTKQPESTYYDHSHFHNYYELYLFVNGDLNYIVNDSIYSLQPYDLLFIKPGVYHNPKLLSTKTYDRFVINFLPEAVDTSLLHVLKHEQVIYRFVGNATVKALFDDFDKFIQNADEQDARLFCRQLVNFLLLQFKFVKIEPKKEIIHPTLTKILQYIDEHLNEPLDVNSIAEKFFVSPSWIFYIFKKNFLMSYTKYINYKKILYAQQLIRSGTSVTQASLMSGFKEYSTFYRQYKKQLKTSPQADKPES
ncbi:MAG: helix-turn-helix transcriptional regulator [Clostridia bacterium]|nr:helix-turn-helix transcriptional regulator [Clostridia bacterium]